MMRSLFLTPTGSLAGTSSRTISASITGDLSGTITNGFSTVYSGWILWNLFLAFVPLLLSFLLFRKKAIPRLAWLGLVGAISSVGVVGLVPRLPRVFAIYGHEIRAIANGDVSAWLNLLWLGAIAFTLLSINLWVFRQSATPRTWKWWVVFVTFIAFLPNAPYLLTDIIHLIQGTRDGQVSTWAIALVFIPIHTAAILVGFEAYVMAVMNQSHYLQQQGARQLILPAELLIHALCSIGIYLGRFIRFNSWDLVTDPSHVFLVTLNTLTTKQPAFVILITFVILTVLYWIMKQVTLGLTLRIQSTQRSPIALTHE